ncbi:MAG: DUF131 domain-containing protein [Nanoarchaeota archaeon]|nr:DUF131 domain-containing protein [Nanoarchaeota archaeon]
MESMILIGIFLIFIGFALVATGTILGAGTKETKGTNVKVAAGGFIGPIPFGFASDKQMFYILVGFMMFVMIMWVVLRNLPS